MRPAMHRIPVGFLLIALPLAVICMAAAGCGTEATQTTAAPPPPPKVANLLVLTPHSDKVRDVFEDGFSQWYQEKSGVPANVRWVHMGTGECLDYIERLATRDVGSARYPMPDLLFGGGVADHQLLEARGRLRAVQLPPELLKELPQSLAGQPMRDENGYWYADALSKFGIIFNRDACSARGIAIPTTWKDLAKPEYAGWVSMADPERSSSTKACLSIILQRYGWDEGWATILKIAANSRTLMLSSNDVIKNIVAGESLVGLCINFNALTAIDHWGKDHLGYLNPTDSTAISPDVISLLDGGSNRKVASRFIEFCLGEEGQKLWSLRADALEDCYDTLYRYPIRPAMYATYASELAVREDPFSTPNSVVVDVSLQQKRNLIVSALLKAACGDNHVLLQQCWGLAKDGGKTDELVKPLLTESEAITAGQTLAKGGPEADEMKSQLARRFKDRYEAILKSVR